MYLFALWLFVFSVAEHVAFTEYCCYCVVLLVHVVCLDAGFFCFWLRLLVVDGIVHLHYCFLAGLLLSGLFWMFVVWFV